MKSIFGCRRSVESTLLSSAVALLLAVGVTSHARLECPPPLSGATGKKVGPCDVSSDNGSVKSFPLKANALNTITWLESISHPGAPVRFALSREGGGEGGSLEEAAGGFETCLLLDHIPHDAFSRPNFRDELSYHRSSITLWIPDVKCERCYLQLISVMSDVQHGVPADTKCAYQGALANDKSLEFPACPAVYHSCSPVSIDGSIPRNEIDVCNTTEFEEILGWPLTPRNNADVYDHSIYYNRADVALYNEVDARLIAVGAPLTDDMCTNPSYCAPSVSFQEILRVPVEASYIALEGTCASVTETKVEAYVPGGVPGGVLSFPSDSEEAEASEVAVPPAIDASVVEEEKEEDEATASSGSLGFMIPSNIFVPASALLLLSLFLC